MRWQYNVYDKIRASHWRGNPFGRYALLQYEHLVNRKRFVIWWMRRRFEKNSTRRRYPIHFYFNRGVELGSSVVTRELHHDGESFRSFYRMTQESLKCSPFLNKQGLYVMDCSPSSFTVFATRLMLNINWYSPVEMWCLTVTHGRGSEGETGKWSG
jgi:hypothetical protein